MTKNGWIVILDEKGHYQWHEQTFPINTNASLVGWMQDFWAAFLERPKILRWVARLAMGNYAFRELYGSKESILKCGYSIWYYSLQDMEYHNDDIPT